MSSIFSNSNNQLTSYSQRKHRSMEWRTAQVRIENFSRNKLGYAEKKVLFYLLYLVSTAVLTNHYQYHHKLLSLSVIAVINHHH